MFEKIAEKLKEALKSRAPVDPATFDDPMATRIAWTPCKSGGTNFCTHKMVRVTPTRIEFKMSLGAKLFCLVFLTIGIAIPVIMAAAMLSEGNDNTWAILFTLLFGAIFAAVGGGMFYVMSTPRVLDAKLGLFWKGRQDPSLQVNRNRLKMCIDLPEIYAIQVISEYCRGSGKNSSSYYSYELNFVLQDGSRVNVVDHGDGKRIRDEAHMLSDCLGIPVWDAS